MIRLVHAKHVLEIGTLGGYSGVWIARALPAGGTLTTIEKDAKHAAIARQAFAAAGLQDRVRLIEGAALDVLPTLPPGFDVVFIDADKEPLPRYFEWGMRLLRPGGLLLCDNAFFHGAAVDLNDQSPAGRGVRAFNELAAADPRLIATIIPVRDGLLVGLKQGERVTWWHELIAAGAVPATFAPPPSAGAGDAERVAEPADVVEDAELQAHALPDRDAARIPRSVAFLAGIERWSVVAYDGVVQVVNAYVAAAIRRRDERGVLRTTRKASRAFALAPVTRMKAELRRRLEEAAPELEPMDAEWVDNPTRYLDQVESRVRRARAAIERDLAEAWIGTAREDDWLVLDGLLSRSPAVARHPARSASSRATARNFWKAADLSGR